MGRKKKEITDVPQKKTQEKIAVISAQAYHEDMVIMTDEFKTEKRRWKLLQEISENIHMLSGALFIASIVLIMSMIERHAPAFSGALLVVFLLIILILWSLIDYCKHVDNFKRNDLQDRIDARHEEKYDPER